MREKGKIFVYCGSLQNFNTTWQWELVMEYKEMGVMWMKLYVETGTFN